MLNFITATNVITGRDMLINLDNVVRIDSTDSGMTEFTDVHGDAFFTEEPYDNVAATIGLIRAAYMTQHQKGLDND